MVAEVDDEAGNKSEAHLEMQSTTRSNVRRYTNNKPIGEGDETSAC